MTHMYPPPHMTYKYYVYMYTYQACAQRTKEEPQLKH